MLVRGLHDTDMAILSHAAQNWYQHYKARVDERTSEVICSAAITFFNRDHHTQEELVELLITQFPEPALNLPRARTSFH